MADYNADTTVNTVDKSGIIAQEFESVARSYFEVGGSFEDLFLNRSYSSADTANFPITGWDYAKQGDHKYGGAGRKFMVEGGKKPIHRQIMSDVYTYAKRIFVRPANTYVKIDTIAPEIKAMASSVLFEEKAKQLATFNLAGSSALSADVKELLIAEQYMIDGADLSTAAGRTIEITAPVNPVLPTADECRGALMAMFNAVNLARRTMTGLNWEFIINPRLVPLLSGNPLFVGAGISNMFAPIGTINGAPVRVDYDLMGKNLSTSFADLDTKYTDQLDLSDVAFLLIAKDVCGRIVYEPMMTVVDNSEATYTDFKGSKAVITVTTGHGVLNELGVFKGVFSEATP